MHRSLICLFACSLCPGTACGPDTTRNEDMASVVIVVPDLGDTLDMPVPDMPEDMPGTTPDMDAQPDMTVEEDMPDAAPDMAEGGLPARCEGDCATQDLTITFGDKVRPITRAVYGLTAPTGPGEPWTLYLEALQGDLDECPEGASSPDYTMIMSGLPIFEDEEPITKQMRPDLNVVLFDYVDDLIADPPFRTRAESVSVSARALSVCEECVGMPAPADEDGFLALTLQATFPEGTIAGDIYAVHCDIMDQPAP